MVCALDPGRRRHPRGLRRGRTGTSGRGQQLIPWPNRIRDGRYSFGGVERQLPLTEVEHGNASHGLVRWAPWRLVERTDTSLTVGHRLFPQPGWDWHLETTTRYAVAPDGLTVTTRVTNGGGGAAPFGYGAHPYVAIDDVPVGEVEVALPGDTWVEVDDRLILQHAPVEGRIHSGSPGAGHAAPRHGIHGSWRALMGGGRSR